VRNSSREGRGVGWKGREGKGREGKGGFEYIGWWNSR